MLFIRSTLVLLVLAFNLQCSWAFSDYLLKTCAQSGFCHRNRQYASNIQESKRSPYSIDPSHLIFNDPLHTLRGTVVKRIPQENGSEQVIELPFTLDLLEGSKAHFTIDELRDPVNVKEPLNTRRYNETLSWALHESANLFPTPNVKVTKPKSLSRDKQLILKSEDKSIKMKLHLKTFKIEVFYMEDLVMTINDRMLLNLEHLRKPENNAENKLPEEIIFNDFHDDFQYSREDTIPFGPESVALDLTFNGMENVYGIPEHADSLRLKDTTDSDPYRLFNVDVFEYNTDSKMPMYGAIPLMIGTRPGVSAGVFWANAADTWIDIKYDESNTKTHWISEAGIIDVIIFFAETPLEITKAYTNLTGTPSLPLLSAVGYHQCRWNYNDERDVLTVDYEMDKAEIPYDFIWLDLEYTEDKKYFTWKPEAFPNPQKMLKKLWKVGRNMVTLIDPHIKVGYDISETIERSGTAVKNSINEIYHGHCWPGESIWIDSFSRKAQGVWGKFVSKFVKNANNLFIWNDMNEPSIFSGPETTAPKDLLHDGGYEERSVHNLYGLTLHETTYNSLKQGYAKENKRPFVLTRAFFAGSQRSAATWTGDNVANWDYLKISIPMCLTNNIAGFPFIGADIAGFSGNPSDELLVRWYQTGMWYPFFRAHAHIDTLRREPYLLKESVKSIVRDVIRLRYALLPTFYTAFHDASVSGVPVMNPIFYEKPTLEETYRIDDEFYLGRSGLLVKPVTEEGCMSTQVFFPPGIFYDYFTLQSFSMEKSGYRDVDVSEETLPLFIEGGHIIVRKDRYRRSARLMARDPFTLLIAPNATQEASGNLYVDDGETYSYQEGNYLDVLFTLKDGILESSISHYPADRSLGSNLIEDIIIATPNFQKPSGTILIQQGDMRKEVNVQVDPYHRYFKIPNPLLEIGKPWTILF
ncbi:LAFE_0C06810g1_1 [Lachancea fermentati]|uniref:Glucosidase II subunit alpha n=1 Tax=Lachancea fermentati TaxID=4955 RepID=A0A1G4M9M7_LACFM|nr:LAFE_0C06810g1_1 [Lachancea fermentati]